MVMGMNERYNFPIKEPTDHTKNEASPTNGNGNGSSNGNGNHLPPLKGRFIPNGNNNRRETEPLNTTPYRGAAGHAENHERAEAPLAPVLPSPSRPYGVAGQPVLNGALNAFSPSSLLSLLSIQKQTGWLYLRNASISGYIYVDKGEVFDAGIGLVSSGALAVFQLFGWKQGEFVFDVGSPPPDRRTIEVSLPVLQVRATLWLDNMNKYVQYIPSPSHLVTIASEPRSEVVIDQYQWPVLTKIVTRPISVAELAIELNQDLMTVTSIAAELVKMGVAVVKPPESK